MNALTALAEGLDSKAAEYQDTERLGRTCLQDAFVLTVGQTHRSHATAIRRVTDGLRSAAAELDTIAIGATVLETGTGAPEGYRELCVQELSASVGRQLQGAEDLVDALSHLDPYASVASAGARAAITMAKIAADLRVLSSEPVGGTGEVIPPATQAGSSIMPGKINPVIPEFVMQLSYRIRGRAHTVECAVAAGELELNIMEPVIVDSLLNIIDDLSTGAETFARKCITGLSWDGPRLEENLNAGFDRWVTMASEQGYDATSLEVAKARTMTSEATRWALMHRLHMKTRPLHVSTSASPLQAPVASSATGLSLASYRAGIGHHCPEPHPLWIGLQGAATLAGLFLGAIVTGPIADKIGRRGFFGWDMLVFGFLSAGQFFVQEPWQLLVLRLLVGITLGADYVVSKSLVTEHSPRQIRGRRMSFLAVA
ncbi:MAG TPA: MFS transporter [Arthrobacter sp.]|nr:MFS transporter [Arthrobacter sp.]